MTLTLASVLLALALTVTASAQSGRWIPGLDLIVPGVTVHADQPGAAIFGYDRDTRRASVMFPRDGCYFVWWITPTHGAIRHIFEYRPHPKAEVSSLAVYYEDGTLEVEAIPTASYCLPL